MSRISNQKSIQAVISSQEILNYNQTSQKLSLFNENGSPFRPDVDISNMRYVSSGNSDQRDALNAWLTISNPLNIKQLVGEFNVSDSLNVPAGIYLDLSKAKISQISPNKVTMYLGSGSTVYGGEFFGLGTDYVAGASPSALGISAAGDDCVIVGVKLRNFSGAAIRGYGVNNFRISNVTIVGVGSSKITAGDGGPCNGILVDLSSNGVIISDSDISEVCQGIQTGQPVERVSILGVRIYDVIGQHGLYIQNGTGLNISNLDIRNCYYNGVKIQKAGTDTEDCLGGSITGITTVDCGDNGLIFTNTAADLTSAKVFQGYVVNNVSVVNCKRGVYFGSLIDSSISNISVINAETDAITFVNSRNLIVSDLVWNTCGRVGILFNVATGSIQDKISVKSVRGHNAGNANNGVNLDGIEIAKGSNISLDGCVITADNSFLRYGLFVSSPTPSDQQTLSLKNLDFSGSSVSARFQSPVTNVKSWFGNKFSGSITNKPIGFDGLTYLIGTPSAPGAMNSFLGASFDPIFAGNNLTVLTSGVLFLVKIQIPDGGSLGTFWFATGAGGSGLTSGQNFVGVYEASTSGSLLASSSDQSALSFVSSGGVKSASFISPTSFLLSGSYVYLAFLFNGTTGPTLRGITGSAIAANSNLSVPRFASSGSGLTTLPSTLPSITALLTPVWAAVS